jgi:seryl-tRNA synthetase
MLDIRRIREQEADIRRGLLAKNAAHVDVDGLLDLDRERRRLLTEVEQGKSQRNTVSKEIGVRKKKGEDVTTVMEEMRALGRSYLPLWMSRCG